MPRTFQLPPYQFAENIPTMHHRLLTLGVLTLLCCASCQSASPHSRLDKPALADEYLDLITTHAIYTKNTWHPTDTGGYWTTGITERHNDTAVAASAHTCLSYATLICASDNDWLTGDLLVRMDAAELNRQRLLSHVADNLRHLTAHHFASKEPVQPTWGFSAHSAEWIGALGCAALLIWDDLPTNLRDDIKRIAFAEADRIAAKPPRDYAPGDTGAEENAADTHAPAVALAIDPYHARAVQWTNALKRYAANVYSTKHDRTSDDTIGPDRARNLVATTNLFDDYTLENRHIFHPDTIALAGQHLGEAQLSLQLGDRIHGTALASDFRPYALHHAADAWQNVAKLLLLPNGEFTHPHAADTPVNSSLTSSYLAFVATGLDDPLAREAARRQPIQALRHREKSAEGRILADTNLEWWWEPLLVKRASTALLQHALRPLPTGLNPEPRTLPASDPLRFTATKLLPDSKIFLHRNDNYFASAAWGKRKTGTFTPFDNQYLDQPYLSLPLAHGILPESISRFVEHRTEGNIQILVLASDADRRSALICFKRAVLWLSAGALRPLGLQNDSLTGPRHLYFNNSTRTVPTLRPISSFPIPGSSVNLDNRFGLISTPDGFHYQPAGEFNRKSTAIDAIVPLASWGAWLMVPGATAEQTGRMADAFGAHFDGNLATVTVQDGPAGHRYRIRALLAPTPSQKDRPSVLIDALD